MSVLKPKAIYMCVCIFLQFVMETWKIMEERGIFLNNTCSLLMIEALCKGGYLDEV